MTTDTRRRLVLHPADPEWIPADREWFVAALTERGLFGAPWRDGRYLVGHRFMQEIVFVGCSPYLRVDPRDDLDFCHLQLTLADAPQFRRGVDAGEPRCPCCRRTLQAMRCADCNRELAPQDCLWRRGTTLWARCWISVWTLQKGDAQPTDSLLASLETLADGIPWKTAFL